MLFTYNQNRINMKTRTKSLLTYLGGLVTGIVLSVAFVFIVLWRAAGNQYDGKIVMFDQPQQVLKEKVFDVFQVLPNGNALANSDPTPTSPSIVALFLANEKAAYYDAQRIIVPNGKHAVQIGIYRYYTANGIEKTVPVLEIRNK